MKIKKRSGHLVDANWHKLTEHVKYLANLEPKLTFVDPSIVTQKTISGLYDGVTTIQINELLAENAAMLSTKHYEYSYLASRILVANLHKNTPKTFQECVDILYSNKDAKTGEAAPLVSYDLLVATTLLKDTINEVLDPKLDYERDYFGLKTLYKSYLIKSNGNIIETPQYMYMRVAIGIHGEDTENVKKTYLRLAQGYYTHATPTLFNSGTPKPQMSSCFLLTMKEDSIAGIYSTLSDCAAISQTAGGIGLAIHDIRATGSYIKGTGGVSNGIVPMLKVFNETARYVDQCFSGDSIIYSKRGPLKFKDLLEGDEVLSEDGNYNKVLKKMNYHSENKTFYKLKTAHSINSIFVTDQHPLLVIKDQRKGTSFSVIKRRLELGIIKPEYEDVKELDENALIGYPIIKYEIDNSNLSEDDCRFYGILVGDGCVSETNEVRIYLGNKKVKTLEFLKTYCYNNILEYSIYERENNCICFYIKKPKGRVLKFTRENLYDGNKDKIILPNFLHLPENKQLKLLQGLLETDGNIGKEITFSTSSLNVMESIKYITLKLGFPCSGQIRDRIGEVSTYKDITTSKLNAELRIPKDYRLCNLLEIEKGEFFKYFRHGDHIYFRLKNIKEEKYDGIIYDLEVDKNHTYTTEIGIAHNGGGKRKGSFAIYIEPWHADIFDFLDLKKNTGKEEMRARDLFPALWIPDLFMERVETNGNWTLMCPNECPGLSDVYGDDFKLLYERYEAENKGRKTIKAQELWTKILDSQIETGTPYMLYKDAANSKSNQKNLGTIKSSNLCVAPETLLLTDKGNITIKDLENEVVNIWNGKQWSTTKVVKTGENQKLLKVTLSDGKSLDCTEYHKWYVQKGYKQGTGVNLLEISEKRTFELEPGDKLIKLKTPVIEKGNETNIFLDAYTQGFFSGDGCRYKDKNHIDLYGEKILLAPHLEGEFIGNYNSTQDKQRFRISDSYIKFEVPLQYNIKSRIEWLEGLCDSDGTLCKNKNTQSIQIGSIEFDFLKEVQLMLQELGVQSKIKLSNNEGYRSLPDGKGGVKDYLCRNSYRLLIGAEGIKNLQLLNFKPRRLSVSNSLPNRNSEHFVKVVSVEDFNRKSDTYCVNELLDHKAVFNGILTGNCTEILEYTSPTEQAVCNLASIAVNKCLVKGYGGKLAANSKSEFLGYFFDHDLLFDLSYELTINLNRVIDGNHYPTPETKLSNLKHRPVGLGIQGLADTFAMMNIAFDSEEAKELNDKIFETIYFASLTASKDLAIEKRPYDSFEGSPTSKGILQYDMWNKTEEVESSSNWDWKELKIEIIKYGVRNSLLVAPMPTASTASILGNNECFEPYTSNLYTRRVLSGEFIMVNKHLVDKLVSLNLWNDAIINKLKNENGSVQNIPEIPTEVKEVFKTVWEISQKKILEMAADRGKFICQSQSMNVFMENANFGKLTSMHFYGWKLGLKTGMYYLRTKAAADAIKFTAEKEEIQEQISCSIDNPDDCEMCGA